MALTSGKYLPVGLRYVSLFELNTNGRPKATNTTPYEGLKFEGPTAFSLTIPEPRDIDFKGRDGVIQSTVLPPLTSIKAKLNVSSYQLEILSLITGVPVGSIGEAKEFMHGTSLQGYEPLVGMMCYSMCVDAITGALGWEATVFPKVRLTYAPGGKGENPEDMVFNVKPSKVSSRLWGKALALETDLVTRAEYFTYHTEGEPRLYSYVAPASEDEYSFPAGVEALSTAKIEVYDNGTKVTAMTATVTKVTFTAAPTEGHDINIWTEI